MHITLSDTAQRFLQDKPDTVEPAAHACAIDNGWSALGLVPGSRDAPLQVPDLRVSGYPLRLFPRPVERVRRAV